MNTRNMPLAARPRIRTRPSVDRSASKAFFGDVFAFVVALSTSFSVRVVGDLPVSEILLIPMVPVLVLFSKRRRGNPLLRNLYILLGVWLVGQILTDLYRQTPAADWMRGDAAIIFFSLDITGLFFLLSENSRRKIVFVIGYVLGTFLVTRFAPSRSAQGEPWKFGYAGGTILLVVLLSCFFYRYHRYLVVGFLYAGIILVNLVQNYRSPILNLLVSLVLVIPIIPERVGRLRLLPRRGSVMRVAVLAGTVMLGGWVASTLVHLATSAGYVTEDMQAKNAEQASAKGGMLLSGRPEILVSSRAVMDSPIIGHGSWAKDHRYEEMLSDMMVEQGLKANLEDVERGSQGLIPSHSHIMGAWVWAGILGAIFWVYLYWQVVRSIVRVTILRPPLAPLYAYFLVEYSWDILFSPFGSTLRMYESLVIVIILDLLESAPQLVRLTNPLRRRPWRRRAWVTRAA